MTRVNSVRLPGLATGMETDSVVKQMLSGEQNKVDRAKQKEQTIKWQQEIYRDVMKDVKSFQDKYFSVTSKDSITSSKAWNSVKISSSDEKVMTATGSAGANDIDYKFEVKSLAKPYEIVLNKSKNGKSIERNSSLKDLGLEGKKEFAIQYWKDKENYKSKSTKNITIIAEPVYETDASGNLKLDKNGEKIIKEPADTISTLIEKINSISDGKVYASYSDMTGKFTIKSTETGSESNLSIIEKAEKKPSDEKPSDALDFLLSAPADISKGSDSEVVVTSNSDSKLNKTIVKKTNSFTVDGINYNINGIGSSSMKSSHDVEPVVENMKKFVEDYNKIMDKVYRLVTEKKNKDYSPLTDAQKEDMSEKEIEKWEKKAKIGLLRNDSEMRSFMDSMQNAIFGKNAQFLNKCGLTSSEDYNKRGQLSINEDKFRKSLQNEGDRVFKAFAGEKTSMLEKMKDTMHKYIGSSSSVFARKAGLEKTSSVVKNYFSEQIRRQEDMIKRLQKKMDDREEKLYKQFGQLEASMNKLNSQMNYFAQV